MAQSSNSPVPSGVAYVVSAVDDRPPETLDGFVAHPVVRVTVESDHQTLDIRGCARFDGDDVLLYEKDHDGTGKDVRTWLISTNEGRFEAAVRSAF